MKNRPTGPGDGPCSDEFVHAPDAGAGVREWARCSSAIELAQRVRDGGRYAGRMMIISGRLDPDDLKQIAEIRIDAVLNKPCDVGELLQAVRECMKPEAT